MMDDFGFIDMAFICAVPNSNPTVVNDIVKQCLKRNVIFIGVIKGIRMLWLAA